MHLSNYQTYRCSLRQGAVPAEPSSKICHKMYGLCYYVSHWIPNQIVDGPLVVGSNLNIQKGIEWMTEYTQDKAFEYGNVSLWNLEQMNLSSHAPRRQSNIPHSQSIADQNYNCQYYAQITQKGTLYMV